MIDLTFFPVLSIPPINLQLRKCLMQLPFKSLDVLPQWYARLSSGLHGSLHKIIQLYQFESTCCLLQRRDLWNHAFPNYYIEVLSSRAGGAEPSYVETCFISREKSYQSALPWTVGGGGEFLWQWTERVVPGKETRVYLTLQNKTQLGSNP